MVVGAVVAASVWLACVGDVTEVSVVNTGDVMDVSVNVSDVPEVDVMTSVGVLLGVADEVPVSLVAEVTIDEIV